MVEEKIANLMIDQHALIEALFFVFKDEAKEKSKDLENCFSDFSWEIKKHFFVEERAIFDYLPWSDPTISATIKQLEGEHVKMISELAKMAEDLTKVSQGEIESFYKLLKGHREMEEKSLYPVLDKKLSKAQKEQIVSHINEIPIIK
jgi:hemerythrin-like domain-containing protein